MITIDLVELGRMFTENCDKPTPLYQDDQFTGLERLNRRHSGAIPF